MRLPDYFLIHLLLITRTESQQPRIIATPRSSHRPASSTSSSSSPQHPSFSENAQKLLALAAKHGPNPSALSRPHDIQDAHRKISNHPRRLLGPSELHAKNCPNGGNVGGVCEKAPTAMPSSGASFNSAGAVELVADHHRALIRYTVDGSEPTNSNYAEELIGRGVVQLHVNPACPQNRFSRRLGNELGRTYCTFAPMERIVTVKAKVFGRQNRSEEDSAILSTNYSVWTGRHGRAILVPFYHGEANELSVPYVQEVAKDTGGGNTTGYRREVGLGFSGKLVEVQLNTMPFKTVHLHDVITDFAEFTQFFDGVPKSNDPETDSDVVGLDIADSGGSDNQFIDGAFSSRNAPHEFFVNAYEVQALNLTNTWSRALGTVPYVGQLKVLDLSKSKPEANKLRGFWSGFAMRGPLDVSGEQVEYGVLVPYFDGEQYSSIAVRIDLARYHHAANNTGRAGAVAVLDLAKALEEAEEAAGATNEEATVQARRARGFARGFAHGAFAYFVPLYDGLRAGSLVVRVRIDDFTAATVEALDLADPLSNATTDATKTMSKDLAGFQGGQAYVDENGDAFGLLVPYQNAKAPLHGANSKLTADGFSGEWAFDRDYGVPGGEAYGGEHRVARFSSTVVRFAIPDGDDDEWGVFKNTTFDVLDLAKVDPDLRGFSDGVVVGACLYLVPFRNRDTSRGEEGLGYFGKVVRIDLRRFTDDPRVAIQVLDLTQIPDAAAPFGASRSSWDSSAMYGGSRPDLVGFTAGIAWGKTLLLVPGRNAGGLDSRTAARRKGATQRQPQHGKLVGIDLSKPFGDPSAVRVLDLSTVTRQQIPKLSDPELRGFSGGFAAGDYAYMVPYSNGLAYFGKVVRVDMRDFDALSDKQSAHAALLAEQRKDDEEREYDYAGNPLSQVPNSPGLGLVGNGDDGTDDGSRTGTNSLGHDGVQVLDVQWQDRELCGFSGGFASFSDT